MGPASNCSCKMSVELLLYWLTRILPLHAICLDLIKKSIDKTVIAPKQMRSEGKHLRLPAIKRYRLCTSEIYEISNEIFQNSVLLHANSVMTRSGQRDSPKCIQAPPSSRCFLLPLYVFQSKSIVLNQFANNVTLKLFAKDR